MTRQEAIWIAEHVAAATPSVPWFVVYWHSSDSHQVMTLTEFEASGQLMEGRVVHVARATPGQAGSPPGRS
jgi:hypothetical protein